MDVSALGTPSSHFPSTGLSEQAYLEELSANMATNHHTQKNFLG